MTPIKKIVCASFFLTSMLHAAGGSSSVMSTVLKTQQGTPVHISTPSRALMPEGGSSPVASRSSCSPALAKSEDLNERRLQDPHEMIAFFTKVFREDYIIERNNFIKNIKKLEHMAPDEGLSGILCKNMSETLRGIYAFNFNLRQARASDVQKASDRLFDYLEQCKEKGALSPADLELKNIIPKDQKVHKHIIYAPAIERLISFLPEEDTEKKGLQEAIDEQEEKYKAYLIKHLSKFRCKKDFVSGCYKKLLSFYAVLQMAEEYVDEEKRQDLLHAALDKIDIETIIRAKRAWGRKKCLTLLHTLLPNEHPQKAAIGEVLKNEIPA